MVFLVLSVMERVVPFIIHLEDITFAAVPDSIFPIVIVDGS